MTFLSIPKFYQKYYQFSIFFYSRRHCESQIPRSCQPRWRDATDIFDILCLRRDSSSNKFQSQMTFRLCASLLKLGTHYPTSLRKWDNSTNRSYCTAFVISESHCPTSLRSWDNSTNASNFTSFVFSESH